MTATGPVLFIRLDVHTNSIAVSLAPSEATEVRRYGLIVHEHENVLKLAKKLADAQGLSAGAPLRLARRGGVGRFVDGLLICWRKLAKSRNDG